MKAIGAKGWGRLNLKLEHRKPPTPGPNDVLVKVHAASVNPKDWKLNTTGAALATPLGRACLPPLFGDDLAGVVVALGRKVTDFQVGDQVFGMDMNPRTATLAELAVIDESRIAKMPTSQSFEQAAAMPLAALTALQGLRVGHVKRGSRVLIIGASGGVGTYAVQIAKSLGAHVTAVCSDRNSALVKELGADVVIDYTQGEFRQSSGVFDTVFDVASYDTPRSCKALLGKQGRFVSTFGHASGVLSTLVPVNPRFKKVLVKSNRADLEELARLADSGQLKSIIDSEFSLAQSHDAYERSRSGRARGKIVIKVADGTNQAASQECA